MTHNTWGPFSRVGVASEDTVSSSSPQTQLSVSQRDAETQSWCVVSSLLDTGSLPTINLCFLQPQQPSLCLPVAC